VPIATARERFASLQLPGVRIGAPPAEPLRRLPTGIAALDELLGGGLPRGHLSEIVGGPSSGRTALLHALLASATQRGEVAAVVDLPDALDPPSLARARVDLERAAGAAAVAGSQVSAPSSIPPAASAAGARGLGREPSAGLRPGSPVTEERVAALAQVTRRAGSVSGVRAAAQRRWCRCPGTHPHTASGALARAPVRGHHDHRRIGAQPLRSCGAGDRIGARRAARRAG
jgi:hypothetical protein